MTDEATTTIIVSAPQGHTQSTWQPKVGPEADALREIVAKGFGGKEQDANSAQVVVQSASDILSTCLEPKVQGMKTVLVVGHIQSGKTASMSAATALARDNGYDMVILLGGTTVNLLGQTEQRLENDLRLDELGTHSRWRWFRARDEDPSVLSKFAEIAAELQAEGIDAPTILVTVMKQYHNLDRLLDALALVRTSGASAIQSVLIIDDEADQAGLNTGGDHEAEWSATYAMLSRLREMFDSVTTIQYTATPQAPLLIDLEDELSPDVVHLLSPGSAYTGGQTFFQDDKDWLLEEIPASEVAKNEEGNWGTTSLKRALATFWTGRTLDPEALRSMLVHNSRLREFHSQISAEIESIRAEWQLMLSSPLDSVKNRLVRDWIEPAYESLRETNGGEDQHFAALDSVLRRLNRVMTDTRIEVVNSDDGKEIIWSQSPGWILVGGQKLDRGFTIKGLSVTHLSRPLGGNMADSIQQRARFFGYRRSYLDRCRVWLTSDLREAFESYVTHEKVLRDSLSEAMREGKNLKEWRREFVLGAGSQPTRAAVIRLERESMATLRPGDWFRQQNPLGNSEHGAGFMLGRNRTAMEQLVAAAPQWEPWGEEPWCQSQPHYWADIPCDAVLDFLDDFEMTGPRDPKYKLLAELMIANSRDDDRSPGVIRVIKVGRWDDTGAERNRGTEKFISDIDPIAIPIESRRVILFQGANRSVDGFPGDHAIFEPTQTMITLQLHRVNIFDGDFRKANSEPAYSDVPVIAFRPIAGVLSAMGFAP